VKSFQVLIILISWVSWATAQETSSTITKNDLEEKEVLWWNELFSISPEHNEQTASHLPGNKTTSLRFGSSITRKTHFNTLSGNQFALLNSEKMQVKFIHSHVRKPGSEDSDINHNFAFQIMLLGHLGNPSVKLSSNQQAKLTIGSYKVNFGNHLCLGSSNSFPPAGSMDIKAFSSPNLYNPLGSALLLKSRGFSLMAMVSTQNRAVTLQDSLISYLSRTKTERINETTEQIMAIATAYETDNWQLGILHYNQEYDLTFDQSYFRQIENALSSYFSYRHQDLRLSGENAWLDKHFAAKYHIGYETSSFGSNLSWKYLPKVYRFPYSAVPFRLSASTQAQELNWRLDYSISKHYSISYYVTILNQLDRMNIDKWKSSNGITVEYSDLKDEYKLSLERIDRSVLVQNDSLYYQTIPRHFRSRLHLKHQINSRLSYRGTIRYNFEQKSDLDRNSFYWDNHLVFQHQRIDLKASFTSWLAIDDYIESDEFSEPHLITKKQDRILIASTEYCHGKLNLDLSIRASLNSSNDHSISFRIKISL